MNPNCQSVLSAVAYYCPLTGEVFIIEILQAILIDHLHNNLLYTIQMRMYGVKLNYISIYLTDNPTDQTHSIVMQ